MSYIASSAVTLFPSASRSGDYSSGKFTTEKNLTNFLRSVTAKNDFMIADPNVSDHTSPHYNENYYIFVLHGFYFEATKDAINGVLAGASTGYVAIRWDSAGMLVNWEDGSTTLDNNNSCTALYVSSTAPTAPSGAVGTASLNIKASNRFTKFDSDSFYVLVNGTETSLTDVLNTKQNTITTTNKLNIEGTVSGELAVENGGTGATSLSNVTVGKASALNVSAAIGEAGKPVYINASGTPVAMNAVTNAVHITDSTGTASAVGSTTTPVYIDSTGVPQAIGSTINAKASGLQVSASGVGKQYWTDATSSAAGSGKFQPVYIEGTNGTPVAGSTIHISTASPTSEDVGAKGDIWFKYTVS